MKLVRWCARVVAAALLFALPQVAATPLTAALAATVPCTASNISGGDTYSAAISNGQLFTWGRNVEGELGLGFTSTQVLTPTAVSSNPLLTNVSGVWAGFITTFAVDPSGHLWAWGSDGNAQTGTGASSSSPVGVSGPTNVVSVGPSHSHTIAATSDGTVWGWGQSSGLGVGDSFFTQVNPVVLSTPPHVVKVAAGFRYSLLLTSDGRLYGAGAGQALGIAGSQFVPTFTLVPGLSGVVDVSASESIGSPFTLAIDGTGHVWGFGSNQFGQMGGGTVGDPFSNPTPVQVPGLDSVIQVAAGGGHSLALRSNGTVWAWGENDSGQLGIGSTDNTATPTGVIFPSGTEIVRIAAGLAHSMAVDSAGNVWVWGNDQLGALGTGVANQNQLTPIKINLAAACPGLPPPPTRPSVTSLSPSFGPAEGSTQVTINGTGFTNAETVQFGSGQPLMQPCVSTSSRFCFTVIDDLHITVLTFPHAPANVDVFVSNVAGSSDTSPGDVYSYEGWIAPTPTDKSAFDIPVGHSASFTVKALEQGAMTIGHTDLPSFMHCTDTTNPGQPAQVDCTVLPTRVGIVAVTFFDLSDPNRITRRTYLAGRGAYAAMGDSFAAGDGATPYIPPTDTNNDKCHRSYFAYPRVVSNFLYAGGEQFVACSGAVIRDVVVGSQSESSQLAALDNTVDLVTIMIGGDDINFGPIARQCVEEIIGCEFDISSAPAINPNNSIARIGNEANAGQILTEANARPLPSTNPIFTLDNIYATIRSRAPNARVLVVGYPDLLPPNPILNPCPTNLIADDEVFWLNSVEKYLNDTIEFEAARNGAEFVQGSTTVFADHELCTHDPYVVELIPGLLFSTPFHPNEVGHGKMADKVLAQINRGAAGSSFLLGPGQTVTTTATVNSGMGTVSFSTTWPGSDVVLTLISPSGRQITRSTSAADVYHLLGPTYETVAISNPEPGTWTVQMRGADVSPDGETVRFNTVQLPHVNVPPTATFTASPTSGTAPLDVTFDARASSDSDGTIASYAWDFGDGATGTGATPSHTFSQPGIYSIHLTISDDGGAKGFDKTTVVIREPVRLAYSGDTSSDYDDPARLAATLTSSRTGNPIAGARVNLTIVGVGGTQACSATSDVNGVASCTLTLTLRSGAYTVTARIDQTDQLAAASISSPFTVNAEQAAVGYTGPPALASGANAQLSATLLEDGTTPIAGRAVSMTLGSGASLQSCTAITTAVGVASCSVAVTQPLGPAQLSVAFAGDGFYAATTTTISVVVFTYATGGAFVVGDVTAGAPTPLVGTNVTFWGSQWAAANTLSGGAAPIQFLGFESSTSIPRCGATWTGPPAASGTVPASVPSYIAIIVADTVTSSAPTVSGDTVHVVIVHVAPGYANDAGHNGTGTIVATLC